MSGDVSAATGERRERKLRVGISILSRAVRNFAVANPGTPRERKPQLKNLFQ